MNGLRTSAVLTALCVFGLAATASAQVTLYVDASASGLNTGTNWPDAYVDLQSALGVAAAGDEIWVARGLYIPGPNRIDTFTVPRFVSLYGGFTNGMDTLEARNPGLHMTVLSGDVNGDDTPSFGNRSDNVYHVVRSSLLTPYNNVRIDGFVIRGGNADGVGFDELGGGIFMDTCTAFTLANCVVTDNSAAGSGGLFLRRTTGEVVDSVFSGNRATQASTDYGSGAIGGGNNTSAHTFHVRRSVFTGNLAVSHGGVTYDTPATWPLNFENCLLAGNSSGSNGGGLYLRNGTNLIWNCTIAGNSPNGIYVQGTTNAYVNNSIIWSNAIPEVDTGAGELTPSFSDINRAFYAGVRGNIQAAPGWLAGTTGTWTVAGVFTPASGQTRLRAGAAAWTLNAFAGKTVNPDLTQTRQFMVVSNNTTDLYVWGDASAIAGVADAFRVWDFTLGTGSPCIDTGTDVGSPTDDLAKATRPKGVATDMGAYESSATGSVFGVIYVHASAAGSNNGSSWEHAYTNLQSALAVASPDANHQIWVAAGTYKPGSSRTNAFYLVSRVPLYGGFAGTESAVAQRAIAANPTILTGDLSGNDTANFGNRADNAYHVVVEGFTRNVRVDGFIIRGGQADAGSEFDPTGQGGGLFSEGANTNFTIANCVFTDNSAIGGGAVYIKQPATNVTITIVDTVFSGNRATEAGNNRGGGAVSGQRVNGAQGQLLVDRCVFVGNRAPNSIGGAFSTADTTAALDTRFVNCLFAGNQSGYNDGGVQGGGLFLRSGAFSLQNCTLAFNNPYGFTSKATVPTLRNGIVWSNTTASLLVIDQSVNASFSDIDDVAYNGLNGNIRLDPRFSGGTNGVSTAIVYTPATGRSTLSVSGSPWQPGAFVGRALNPNTAQSLQFWILTNSANQVTVWGDLQAVASVGNPFRVYDYRPASDSPAVNAGSSQGAPALDLDQALRPVDVFMDMGAYEFGGSALFTGGVAYVDWTATGANNGTSWGDAFTNLQSALLAVPGGRDIWVAAGTYRPGSSVGDTFLLKANVGVYGGFEGTETQRSERDWVNNATYLSGDLLANDGGENLAVGATNRGDNARHVVTGVDHAILDGVVVVGGNATGSSEADPNAYGGGLFINGTSPTVRNCAFVDNYGQLGGAIAVTGVGATPLIEDCVFSGNWGLVGGSAFSEGAPSFRRCQFAGTHTVDTGGALYFTGQTEPVVENCVFSGNYSEFDGAIRVAGGAGSSNSVRIVNCTMTGNQSAFNGSIYVKGLSRPLLVNSILWQNRDTLQGGQNEIGLDVTPGSAITVRYTDVTGGFSGVGNLNTNPLFVATADGSWTSVGAYNGVTRQTVLGAAGAGWQANQWSGMVVNPNTNQWRRFSVISNTATSLVVWGNAALVSGAGQPYLVSDLELIGSSPCIDVANGADAPTRDYRSLPRPSGGGYDMGAYERQTLSTLGMQLIVW